MDNTNIKEYLSNLVGTKELVKWQRDFHNQDLYYEGFVCQIEDQYYDGYNAPYSGCIYLNNESIGVYVIGESPYSYAKDFWREVDTYLANKK